MPREERTNYKAVTAALSENGPQQLYLLYGEEAYLMEDFVTRLRTLCLDGDTGGFSHKLLSGAAVLDSALAESMDTVPFMSPRTLVEVRDFDVNKCRDSQAEKLKSLISNIPDYCTVVFIMPPELEPDGRLTVTKFFKKYGALIKFTAQEERALLSWISRRFKAYGKTIGREEAVHLIYNSGVLMNLLIPEIEKLSAYVTDEWISREDIDAVALRLPEADIFEMSDKLAAGDYDRAAEIIAALLFQREHPIKLLTIIGQQFRRLYAARVAMDYKLDRDQLISLSGVRYDFLLKKLTAAARGFTLPQLSDILELLAETDYAMKSSGIDNEKLLVSFVQRLALVRLNG